MPSSYDGLQDIAIGELKKCIAALNTQLKNLAKRLDKVEAATLAAPSAKQPSRPAGDSPSRAGAWSPKK